MKNSMCFIACVSLKDVRNKAVIFEQDAFWLPVIGIFEYLNSNGSR